MWSKQRVEQSLDDLEAAHALGPLHATLRDLEASMTGRMDDQLIEVFACLLQRRELAQRGAEIGQLGRGHLLGSLFEVRKTATCSA